LVLGFFQRCLIVAEALETAQVAKRLADFDAFMDRNFDAVHINGSQSKLGAFVVFTQAVHQVITGGDPLRERTLTGEGQGVSEYL
jgi:hypothetical protein